jgi:hypothetical protein
MDDKGNIRQFESDAEAVQAGFKTKLNKLEAEMLSRVPESERHRVLALNRFMAEPGRNVLPDHMQITLRNAFNMGWKAAKESP